MICRKDRPERTKMVQEVPAPIEGYRLIAVGELGLLPGAARASGLSIIYDR